MGYIGQQPAKLALTSSDIADGVVGVADLGANSVDSSELVDGSIDTSHIGALQVTEAKIANDAITLAKMASGTDGNIISYDASGNPVAIATGNDGQVLTSTGAGSPPAFETIAAGGDNTPSWGARLSSTQSISASTLTKCALATEDWDTDSAFDTTNYKMVIPSGEGGKYLLVFGTNIGHMNDGNDVQVVPYVNGSSIHRGIRYWVSNAGVGIYIMASVIYPLAAADYVELYCSWSGSTGGSPTMGNERTLLQGFKLAGV